MYITLVVHIKICTMSCLLIFPGKYAQMNTSSCSINGFFLKDVLYLSEAMAVTPICSVDYLQGTLVNLCCLEKSVVM